MHSLFGTMEVKATHEWFQKRKNRTMIIERSAFAVWVSSAPDGSETTVRTKS